MFCATINTVNILNAKALSIIILPLHSFIIARDAPNAAPAEAPKISGAAIGFWNTPWYVAPAVAKEDPTRHASKILDNLVAQHPELDEEEEN